MPLTPVARVPSAHRHGTSLIEILVVLTIVGVAGTVMGATLTRQQRFYRGAAETLRSREGVRDAIEVLAADIRGLAAADTARLLSDSAFEFFASIGSSVVCGTRAQQIDLPPARSKGNTLTAFLTQPDTGDLALVYVDSLRAGTHWERYRLAGFAATSGLQTCDGAATFNEPAAREGFSASMTMSLAGEIRRGAPVRFVRRGRYSLYRSSDGKWYLGYRRCNAIGPPSCGAVQPLSGPYRAYSSNRNSTGLLFEYFDAAGVRLEPGSPLDLARVDLTVRAESGQRILIEGRERRYGDSSVVSVAIRNRAR